MKKIGLLIIKSSLAAVCTPACVATIPLIATVSDKNVNDSSNIIPTEWLNIVNENGERILKGFVPGITMDDIREGNYSILELPSDENNYVTQIAPYAFAYMFDGFANSIKEIRLNEQLKKIGQGAFIYCTGIEKPIDFSQTELEIIDQDAFNMCMYMTGELKFPATLKTIGNSAFRWCALVDSIQLPSTIETIDDYAFNNCKLVSKISLVGTTEQQHLQQPLPMWTGQVSYAFQNVGASVSEKQFLLENLFVPLEQWETVLHNNLQLDENFEITCGDKEAKDETTLLIENGVLKGFRNYIDPKKYTVIRLPDTVTSIADEAFSSDDVGKITTPTRIILNEGLVSIGDEAFKNCTGLTGQIVFPDSLTTLGQSTFEGSHISGTLSLPSNNDFKAVPNWCFKNCDYINELVIPAHLQDIEDFVFNNHCFQGCDRLSVINVSSFDPTKTPKWKEPTENKPFVDIPIHGTIVYPWDANQSGPEGNIGLKFVGLGLCSTPLHPDKWSARMNKAPYEPLPYNPTEPAKPNAFKVVDGEIAGLTERFKKDENKQAYQIIEIPSGIKKIRDNAFASEFKLTPYVDNINNWVLRFQPGVEEIGEHAFDGSTGIYGNIVLPSTLKSIDDCAFMDINWNSITIPASVQHVGKWCFLQYTNRPEDVECHAKYIDLTQFDAVPNWNPGEYNNHFILYGNGKIYVKSNLVTEWTTLLREKMGLNENPTLSKWTIEGI